jgi:hypothetical protein
VQQPLSGGNQRKHEICIILHPPQSIGGDGKPGESGRDSPATLGPMVHENPGARITSPGTALPGILRMLPCIITRSGAGPDRLDVHSA